jgi:hypothetical protein
MIVIQFHHLLINSDNVIDGVFYIVLPSGMFALPYFCLYSIIAGYTCASTGDTMQGGRRVVLSLVLLMLSNNSMSVNSFVLLPLSSLSLVVLLLGEFHRSNDLVRHKGGKTKSLFCFFTTTVNAAAGDASNSR